MFEGTRVAVVVPAFNEELLLATTLRTIPEYVDQIVVVDDGSTDRTAHVAQNASDGRVTLIKHGLGRGVGAAIATGYRVAFEGEADVAAVMAGDGQMDPADLPKLLIPLIEGRSDFCKGNRLRHADARLTMPFPRYVGGFFLSALTRVSTGLAVGDSQCGYTALSRAMARKLDLDSLWPGYGYPNDLLAKLSQAGARIEEITVRPIYGSERSGLGVRHALFVIPFVIARSFVGRVRSSAAVRPQNGSTQCASD